MGNSLDQFDQAILRLLQEDADLPLNAIADKVHLSRNACWRRIKRLEDDGIIRGRVALLDPHKVNLGLKVLMAVRTDRHTPEWLENFHTVVSGIPEITEVLRISGNTDYLLIAVVPDMRAFDQLYRRLTARVELADVSSSFVMEEIKSTTALPLSYA
ncbi:MAG: Lrp/AsnC family transcriptional regulator [Hyphomicrobiales bacterium]